MDNIKRDWKNEFSSIDQRKLLNSACGDLASGLKWHGFRLSKDDYRHLIAGTILRWRMMPGIDRGDGVAPGLIMLGGSSLDLSVKQCAEAIELCFLLGDCPEGQGIDAPPIRWGVVVCGARWLA
jgi:hypothetical protein